jgi:hypothetical protein
MPRKKKESEKKTQTNNWGFQNSTQKNRTQSIGYNKKLWKPYKE